MFTKWVPGPCWRPSGRDPRTPLFSALGARSGFHRRRALPGFRERVVEHLVGQPETSVRKALQKRSDFGDQPLTFRRHQYPHDPHYGDARTLPAESSISTRHQSRRSRASARTPASPRPSFPVGASSTSTASTKIQPASIAALTSAAPQRLPPAQTSSRTTVGTVIWPNRGRSRSKAPADASAISGLASAMTSVRSTRRMLPLLRVVSAKSPSRPGFRGRRHAA